MVARSWRAWACVGIASAACVVGNANWFAPPRYDGAGYAVLARSLLEQHSYRAIDRPGAPRHGHFPPGYPALLAAVWKVTGTSVQAAHLTSAVCTVLAAIAAWRWFRRFMAERTALILGVAVGVNWLWGRIGSAILSEPLYMLLSQLAILVAWDGRPRSTARTRRWLFTRSGSGGEGPPALGEAGAAGAPLPDGATLSKTLVLSVLLAACLLTRHVGFGLLLAILLDRIIARRWREMLTIALVTGLLVLPWLVWLAGVGSESGTQAGMLLGETGSWSGRLGSQARFYMMRIPDQVTGPVVEFGAGVVSSNVVRSVAGLWGLAATAIFGVGLVIMLLRTRMRLAALIPLITLCVLLAWPFTEAGRFLIPLVPCLLVAGLEGLCGPCVLLAKRGWMTLRPTRARRIAAIMLLAASLPYSIYAMISGRAKALEASQRDFDFACDWLVHHGDRRGVVLSRHPGEVFWQTGRQGLDVSTVERPTERDADVESIASTIAEYQMAYLLIDRKRYAAAPRSPLERFVDARPTDVRRIWEAGEIMIYEVVSPGTPR